MFTSNQFMSSGIDNPETFRRLPQQARSRQRVDRILDVAAQLFEEVGYEAVSTDLIVKRANISIGSLYRFFPDKEAILHALSERYAQQMRKLFTARFNPSTINYPLAILLSEAIEDFDKFYTTQPGCREIMLRSRVSADLQAVNKRVDHQIVEQLDNFLALRQPQMNSQQRQLAALVSVEIANALQLLSLSQDERLRLQLVAETKQVLIRYLQPLFDESI
ncbi:MAG: TetR/AcrR family transcriptional regulator [Nostoc sp. DedQUE11]|nr:TetR/AcrR family transcriptional regulator [Nostoc sp. DedQUE11]